MKHHILFLNMICSSVMLLISCTGGSENASFNKPEYKGLIIAEEINSLRSGVKMLKANGNAVDAAVSMAMTLVQTLPSRASLTGSGMCKVYIKNHDTALVYDFRKPNTFVRAMYMMHTEFGDLGYNAALTVPELLANTGYKPDKILLEDIKNASKVPPRYLKISEKSRVTNKELARLYSDIRTNPVKGYYNNTVKNKINADEEFLSLKPDVYEDNGQNVNHTGQGTTDFAVTDANGSAVVCSISNGNLFGSGKEINGMISPQGSEDYLPGIRIETKRRQINKAVTSKNDMIQCTDGTDCDATVNDKTYIYRVIR